MELQNVSTKVAPKENQETLTYLINLLMETLACATDFNILPVPEQKIGANSTSRVVLKTISEQIAMQNITEVSLYKNTLE